MSENIRIYELTVSKIRCTNCAGKIKAGLQPLQGMKDVKVNVLAEKVIITFDSNLLYQVMNYITRNLESIEHALININFKLVSNPMEIILDSSLVRKAQFIFLSKFFGGNKDIIDKMVQNLKSRMSVGIQEVVILEQDKQKSNAGFLVQVTYQPEVLKARKIFDEIQSIVAELAVKQSYEDQKDLQQLISKDNCEQSVIVYDQLLESFKDQQSSDDVEDIKQLVLALFLTFVYILFIMILPFVDTFQNIMMYPEEAGIFTPYLLICFVVTILTMWRFGFKCYQNAIINYKKFRLLNMDSLVSLGSISAFIMSLLLMIVYEVQALEGKNMEQEAVRMEQIMNVTHMFESTALILTVISIGKFFESRAKRTILTMQQKIFPSDQLLKTTHYTYLEPKNQKFMIDSEKVYEVSLLEKGDLIKLIGGQKLLCDGVILKGDVKVIDSICYGWDDQFMAQPGTRLKSGADIIEGECFFQLESPIETSMLFQIAKQLDVAQSQNDVAQTGITALFQTLADHFVKGVIILALLVLAVWLLLVGMDWVTIDEYCVWCFPFERAISILVASCPCALGLAVPSVVVITLNLALQQGILIKKNTIFERIAKVQHVLFDKTGTLFTKIENINSFQRFQAQINTESTDVQEDLKLVQSINELGDNDIWGIVALMEKEFKHPLGTLLYKEAIKRQALRKATFTIDGEKPKLQKMGIIGNVVRTDLQCPPLSVYIGNMQMLQQNHQTIDEKLVQNVQKLEESGQTVLLMAVSGKVVSLISFDNKTNLRPEAKSVVQYINKVLKKDIYILSGDSKKTVNDVGQYLDIPQHNLLGEMDAEGKRNLLKQKKTNGREVMMIGDGLNDVLSLQEAGVGVSINAKSELNLMAADVIILNENLWKIPILFNLMNLANKVVHINLVWAFAYNIAIAPVAAGVFYPLGFTISPMISSAAMSISSIIVVLISNTMRLFTLDPSSKQSNLPNVKNVQEVVIQIDDTLLSENRI